MENIHIVYSGELRSTARHLKSGCEIITDAPVDNKGKGEAFSPTDLAATALGSCMLTIIGIAAEKHQFSIVGTRLKIHKIMLADPRRIGEIKLEFFFLQNNYSEKEKKIIEKAAKNCPVALSLHPDLVQNLIFNYPQ